ncbi:MAG TPA: hypothetical protein DEP72_00175 [Clostridiales bacterium]|nr:MAG: hypothetical protein A2Y18_08285 [Clostridiales bacterium GWD2_32_19]HCC06568.1 hypothetical protein [Clostridiales bacterium]
MREIRNASGIAKTKYMEQFGIDATRFANSIKSGIGFLVEASGLPLNNNVTEINYYEEPRKEPISEGHIKGLQDIYIVKGAEDNNEKPFVIPEAEEISNYFDQAM